MSSILYRDTFTDCNIFRFSIHRPLQSVGVHFLSSVEIDKFVQQTHGSGDCGGFQLVEETPGDGETAYLVDVGFAVTEGNMWVKLNDNLIRPFKFRINYDHMAGGINTNGEDGEISNRLLCVWLFHAPPIVENTAVGQVEVIIGTGNLVDLYDWIEDFGQKFEEHRAKYTVLFWMISKGGVWESS